MWEAIAGAAFKALGAAWRWLTAPALSRLEGWGLWRAGKGAAKSEAERAELEEARKDAEVYMRPQTPAQALDALEQRARDRERGGG